MLRLLSIIGLVCAMALLGPAAEAEHSTPFERSVRPFLKAYCVKCHGAEQSKGERRFDALLGKIGDDDTLVDFQDILDQLNRGAMPPEKSQQPPAEELRLVVAWITERIASYHESRRPTGRGTVLRRLNAREYRNTLRDLLQLDMTLFDPTRGFPQDQFDRQFDNIGAALVTSGPLLDGYLDAAEQAISKALYPLDRPALRTWTFRGPFYQQKEIDGSRERAKALNHLGIYDVVSSDKHEGAYAPLLDFREGVPTDGVYELRFRAEGRNRINPYDPAFLGLDPGEPLRLGIVPGNADVGALHKPQPIEPLLAEIELTDQPAWYTVRVRLEQGFAPRFTFRNGPVDVQGFWQKLVARYPHHFPKLKPKKESPRVTRSQARTAVLSIGKLPQIRIDEVEIKGPIVEQWPTSSQRVILGDDCEQILAAQTLSEGQVRRQLGRFASRAYRRPARASEIDGLVRLWRERCHSGRSPLEAYAETLEAVLVSPSFLYLDEHADGGSPSAYALASRLSYFLWSTMPDETLVALAESGRLSEPAVLEAQTERMLSDPRASAFLQGFLDTWLNLRDLGSMPPERRKFKPYYQYDLRAAMRRETELFTQTLLNENQSVLKFLDADFTWVNRPLARLYGIDPPAGADFQRVRLTDPHRGGLLGQASVLTVTANGIETSPVLRGVWLLENILGTPPSPPPPDVEPLDPDVRGTTTIRARLQKHRDNASCNDCHRQIDPLGFALESFDPIGQWRERYEHEVPVDSSGELPDGKSFADVTGLKRVLMGQRELFVRSLTGKLLAYALGRHAEPADRPSIDRIVARQAQQGDGLRDLIKQIVLSDLFRAPEVGSVPGS